MINTTNPGRRAPSLFSVEDAKVEGVRSDHVSILSALAGENAEPRSASPAFRHRWIGWLIAAVVGADIVIFAMAQWPAASRGRDAVPAPVASDASAHLVAQIPPSQTDAAVEAPATAVIRDSSGLGLSASQAPITVCKEAGATEPGEVYGTVAPNAVKPATFKLATVGKEATVHAKPRRPTERAAKRTVDSDVDIITAIVRHAEAAAAR